MRRELVRPDRPQLPGEDAYRFRHLLIRDAAYDALPKATRAELHERFATWIGEHGVGLVELDEVVGYHLEQAYRYRAELGPTGEQGRALARARPSASRRPGGGQPHRGDLPAAVSLLGRADELFAPDDPHRLAVLPAFGRAFQDSGDWERSRRSPVGGDVERAGTAGDRRVQADARSRSRSSRCSRTRFRAHDEARTLLAEPLRVFEELGDEAGLARALGLAGQLRFWAGQLGRRDRRSRTSSRPCSRRRRPPQESQSLGYVVIASVHGSTPVAVALELCQRTRGSVDGDRRLEVAALRGEANLEAMAGRIDDARAVDRRPPRRWRGSSASR